MEGHGNIRLAGLGVTPGGYAWGIGVKENNQYLLKLYI
jgi:hypothetical protein